MTSNSFACFGDPLVQKIFSTDVAESSANVSLHTPSLDGQAGGGEPGIMACVACANPIWLHLHPE
jgi:hypothetical protein